MMFPKVLRREATHFELKGKYTRYIRVDEPKRLLLAMERAFDEGKTHFINEIATDITRFAVDYDDGPDPLKVCVNQTPLELLYALPNRRQVG